ncbi:glycosyltransferase [Mycobacterium sp.]|uniref:glycosyltransferase n=1 Tax=Mycobacterium sp. TaxID=1785 RepID=UPI002DA4562D|nr:glycosyltransferase [Mycobacterium sp.]
MGPALTEYSLVFVGPAPGQTAVGDYSEDFVDAVRPYFGEVVEVRTAGPLADGVREIRQYRREIHQAIANARLCRVLVHAELAAGGIGAFWSIAGLGDVPVTATIHDPPQGRWWPAGTKFIAKHRLLFHAIHYPLRPLSTAVEGAVNGRRTLFALTETGRRSIEVRYPKTNSVYVPHIVRERPAVRPVQDRPKAVGFFGHVYRGKGFDQIAGIRAALPDDIVIRVAGRGTESLAAADGIDIVGTVEGPAEDRFFESVRAIVVPYGKRHWYDDTYPASGVVAHATAYRTPVVCTDYGSLAELNEKTGAVVVRTGSADPEVMARDLAGAITSLVNDNARLTEIGEFAEKTRQARSGARTAEAFAAVWSELLARQGV